MPAGTDLDEVTVTAGGQRRDAGSFQPGRSRPARSRDRAPARADARSRRRSPDGSGARLQVTNAPQGGPVFSGPLIQPWTCNNGSTSARTAPSRRPCATSTSPTGPGVHGSLPGPYDPANPPRTSPRRRPTTARRCRSSSARRPATACATSTGSPRCGTRAQGGAPDPTAENPGFAQQAGAHPRRQLRHRLRVGARHRTCCSRTRSSQGFAVASHALDNAGHNCNIVTQAESLVMTKEMVVERFGPLRYTIGTGCSGGSLVQQQVANAYPGVYQGITPQCSFPDAWGCAQQYVDYVGLRDVPRGPDDASRAPDPARAVAVDLRPRQPGQPDHLHDRDPEQRRPEPVRAPACRRRRSTARARTPTGVRCSFQDYMRNVFGVSRTARQGQGPPADQQRRHPVRPVRPARRSSTRRLADPTRPPLTADQFVALNVHAGGYDIDFDRTDERGRRPTRSRMERVYRSGAVNTGAHLDKVAIIDLGGPEPGAFHDVYRKFAMRDRLIREHGTAANQVFWQGQTPLLGDVSLRRRRDLADGRVARGRRGRQPRRPAGAEDHRRQGRRPASTDRCVGSDGVDVPARRLRRDRRRRRSSRSPRIEAGGGDQAPVNGVGPAQGRLHRRPARLPDDADRAVRLRRPAVRRGVHRRAAGGAEAGVPDRRLRLQQAGQGLPGRGAVADLPGRRRPGRLRRSGDGACTTSVLDDARWFRGPLPATGSARPALGEPSRCSRSQGLQGLHAGRLAPPPNWARRHC